MLASASLCPSLDLQPAASHLLCRSSNLTLGLIAASYTSARRTLTRIGRLAIRNSTPWQGSLPLCRCACVRVCVCVLLAYSRSLLTIDACTTLYAQHSTHRFSMRAASRVTLRARTAPSSFQTLRNATCMYCVVFSVFCIVWCFSVFSDAEERNMYVH